MAVLTGAHSGDGACNRRGLLAVARADTIVILMGVAHLREIAADLIASGRNPRTPAAVVRWGTYDSQQTVTGALDSIVDKVQQAGLRAPAVIVIGEVVRLRERLNWFERELAESAEMEPTLAAM